MTREEAIDKLQDLWNEVYNEDSDGYIYAVAIDMAIEALSARDMISRAELFNKLSVVNAPMEANAYKAEVYRIINEM